MYVMYVGMYVCVDVWMYVFTFRKMYVCMCAILDVVIFALICTYVRTYVCMYENMYVCMAEVGCTHLHMGPTLRISYQPACCEEKIYFFIHMSVCVCMYV